jgi:transcriptional regulator of acetoin/glycerol metabolism
MHGTVDRSLSSMNTVVLNGSSLDPYIAESWRRSVDIHRLDQRQANRPHVLTGGEITSRLAPLADFLAIARSESQTLYSRVRDAGYVVMLADASGTCLEMIRNPLMDRELAGGGLEIGRMYSEDIEGTTGIGTCVVENRSVVVHRTDHFLAVHKTVTCTAVPVRGPDGSLVAVLDVSALSSHDDKRSQAPVLQLTQISAEAIEGKLLLAGKTEAIVVMLYDDPSLACAPSDAFLIVREDGVIEGATAAARRMLPALQEARLPIHLRNCFELRRGAVSDLRGRAGGSVAAWRRLPEGRTIFAKVDRSRARIFSPGGIASSLVHGDRLAPETFDQTFANGDSNRLRELAGQDRTMLANLNVVPRIIKKELPILLLGETGSGKEAFARALHLASDRQSRPFVTVNCAALPESLIESELFGYREGAFTGARRGGTPGRVLEANGGTLFLDEIGDMPLPMQARLLRVVAEREVSPLGGGESVRVDIHLICATHRRLQDLVANGLFREDLYYRVNGAVFELPALRQRTDLRFLIERILSESTAAHGELANCEPGLIESLSRYPWPGNIRQLINAADYAAAVCQHGILRLGDFPAEIVKAISSVVEEGASARIVGALPTGVVQDFADRDRLVDALERHRWCVTETAAELGISRATIYRRMARYGIVEPNRR